MNAPALTRPHRARLRIEDFLLLDGSGAFADFAKAELIEGDIYCMNAQYYRHGRAKTELAFRLRLVLPPGLAMVTETAVAMPPHDMPEPDIIVLEAGLYEGPIPLAAVQLLVEVSDTTLDIDLGRKAAVYARHGVPEYWVVDVQGRQVHVHRDPSGGGYDGITVTAFGTPLTSLAGLTVATDDLA